MRYWTYYINPKTLWYQVLQSTWTGSYIDFKRKAEGRIYDTNHQADNAAKTRISELKNNAKI